MMMTHSIASDLNRINCLDECLCFSFSHFFSSVVLFDYEFLIWFSCKVIKTILSVFSCYTLHTRHWIMMRQKNRCMRRYFFFFILFLFLSFCSIIFGRLFGYSYCYLSITLVCNVCCAVTGAAASLTIHTYMWCIEIRKTKIETRSHKPKHKQ